MEKRAFQINIPGYELRSLTRENIPALQTLFEQCADYVRTVEGMEVGPGVAEEAFTSGPPGRSLEDKFLYGLFDSPGAMVGYLEGFRNYPEKAVWWIGLLMLAPAVRGQGIGRALVDAFAAYVRQLGGNTLMLGVVEDNEPAYAFWQRIGFTLDHKTEPRVFGEKKQGVLIMRRLLRE